MQHQQVDHHRIQYQWTEDRSTQCVESKFGLIFVKLLVSAALNCTVQ